MILKPGEFQTLSGPIWAAHLGMARARREAKVGCACTNASCSVRQSCGRFGRSSEFSSTWPGGTNCHGFQLSTVGVPQAA